METLVLIILALFCLVMGASLAYAALGLPLQASQPWQAADPVVPHTGYIGDLRSLHIHTMDHSLCTLTTATVAFIPHESLREFTERLPGVGATC